MKYKFPKIETLDDVLPHVEGRDEFIVAERDFGTVVNYNVVMPDTFTMQSPDDLGAAIRRECRGIIFDKEGKIMSRPFHKFFNINEREETQSHRIDLSEEHVRLEKMDGSMIRPIMSQGKPRLATKMGITDISIQAEKWLKNQPDYEDKSDWLIHVFQYLECTPIFEWVAPYNKIVVNYDEEDLVLLAMRDNVTGEYLELDPEAPFNIVPQYGSIQDDLKTYLENARELTDREGDIIRFSDGHMLKIKNDWYVRIHKTMDAIRFDRNIIALILNEEIDDVIGMLPEEEQVRCRKLEEWLWNALDNTVDRIETYLCDARKYETRKDVATKFVPTLTDKRAVGIMFKVLDGKGSSYQLVLDQIHNSLGSNVKWDECEKWLNM